MRYSSESGSSFPLGTPLLDSSHNLRFPKPTADARITTWVQSISNKKMSSDSEMSFDEEVLGGSTYELINTDGESHDENATESVASTDLDRLDDVTSFISTESSGEENNEENLQESIQYNLLDETAKQNLYSSRIGHNSYHILNEIGQPISPPIEFEESFEGVGGKIYVKHTVAELDEEQSSNALRLIPIDKRPKKVVLSVRQTITKYSLSVKEPLRILYVGSHLAKQDIIHKIASSVIASEEEIKTNQQRSYSGSQHFNVVPISAFGSEKTPEVELMHSSRYQIKVDNCHSAQNIKSKNNSGNPDTIKLVLDDDFICCSILKNRDRFLIEPKWELPHIAIFFCSAADDKNIRRTRAIVRRFLSRHDVPSIFISQVLLLNCGLFPSIDKHSIHMCLESKASREGEAIVHQKLPIDLETFLNIDARQINRNLAFVTGLHEPLIDPIAVRLSANNLQALDKNDQILKRIYSLLWSQGTSVLRYDFSPRICLLGLFIAILTVMLNYKNVSGPAISVNSKTILNSSRLQGVASSNTISPIILASSKLVGPLTRDTSGTCDISLGPKSFLESSNEDHGSVEPRSEIQSSKLSCTAEVHGEKEILIRFSGNKKFIWPKSEGVSIKITRNNITVDTDQAFAYEDGLVILIPKNEAYGLIDVSINTVKTSSLDESCTLDFGSSASQILQVFKNKISSLIHQNPDEGRYLAHLHRAVDVINNLRNESRVNFLKISNTCYKAIVQPPLFGDNFPKNARAFSPRMIRKFVFYPSNREIAKKYFTHPHASFNVVRNHVIQSRVRIFKNPGIRLKKSFSLETIKKSGIWFKKLDIKAFTGSKRTVNNYFLTAPQYKILFAAQVKSKIIWLKLWRKEEEAFRYRIKAEAYMRSYSQRKRGCH